MFLFLIAVSECIVKVFSHYEHSVFWDLYCAAPERRDTCDHSSEAKAFHDYVSHLCQIHPSLPSYEKKLIIQNLVKLTYVVFFAIMKW